jgi:type I restriction enzyme S subunit
VKVGWETKTLGDVCEFQRGLTYAKSDEVDVSENIVLRATNIDLATNLLDFSELKYINEKVVVPASKKVKVGSLMICTASGSKSHLGKVAFIDEDYGYAFGGFMGMVTPCPELQPKYLFYRMTSSDYKDFIAGLSDGANINNLKFDDLQRFSIPYPPLPEQQRIVAILDQAFAAIATARAHAEQNLQNARAVFDSHLQAVFSQRGDGWVETTIGATIKFIDYRGKTPTKTESGIRLITAKNIKMGYIQETPQEFIATDNYTTWMTRGIPKKGDVLFTTEAPLANVAQLDTNEKVAFAQRVIIMQPDVKRLDSTFLKYLLLSPPVQKRIREKGTGATVQGIKASLLKQIEISFPKQLNQQQQIISTLDTLREQTQALESLYQCKIAALDELKQSLLHQAFSGAL